MNYKEIKLYQNYRGRKMPLQEFFEILKTKNPFEGKIKYKAINSVIDLKSKEEYDEIYDILWVSFNPKVIKSKYKELKEMNLPFEEDIIRYIAFLFGTDYFKRIGDPDFKTWLNAKDINHPFEEPDDKNEGYSLLEASQYKYGQNAIRSKLGTAWRVIFPTY